MNWTSFGSGFLAGMFGGQLLKRLFSGVTNAIQGLYRTIVDDTRSLFNDNVIDGKFDMTAQITSDAETYKKSKTALRTWFKKYAKTHLKQVCYASLYS